MTEPKPGDFVRLEKMYFGETTAFDGQPGVYVGPSLTDPDNPFKFQHLIRLFDENGRLDSFKWHVHSVTVLSLANL